MDYKLLPRFRDQFAVEPQFVEPTLRPVPARVLEVKVKPQTRSMHRYDIGVDGTHNYFVDSVMVHNSPETTSGGRALKFYASVRLDVRRIETLKDGQEAVGNRVRIKVVKNKVSPPFKMAEVDLLFGQGISREGGLIDVGVEQGLVRKSGAWYTYDGDQLGQGKENARPSCATTRTWPTSWRRRSRRSSASAPSWTSPPSRRPCRPPTSEHGRTSPSRTDDGSGRPGAVRPDRPPAAGRLRTGAGPRSRWPAPSCSGG
jgi:hypothetical protein